MKLRTILILMILTLLTGCSFSYRESAVNKRYLKLNNKLDKLMDDEIDEDDRADLEEQFSEFINGMKEYKEENPKKDTQYINEYINKSEVKLEYLKDMKD